MLNKEPPVYPGVLKDRLVALCDDQLRVFSQEKMRELYGIGFFADAASGTVFLVANTRGYHKDSFQAMGLPADREPVFKWDIGNWMWPGGLFPSSSKEQRSFDAGWAEAAKGITLTQESLEELCNAVLQELHDMPQTPLREVEGMIVLGPDESEETILRKLKVVQ